MAPIRAGGGRCHRDGLRADRSSAIAQRRGDPCPQSRLVSKAKSVLLPHVLSGQVSHLSHAAHVLLHHEGVQLPLHISYVSLHVF